MKKIIIIGDSTAMPRHGLPYEDTWLYRLKEAAAGMDIIDRSARGATSDRLLTEGGGGADLLETYMPDAAVIALGITDCAPRLFKRAGFEYKMINRFLNGRLRAKYIDYIKRRRGRDPDFTEVPPERYRYNLKKFSERAAAVNCPVIIIKIMQANSSLTLKSPSAGKNINLYNSIIDEICAEKKEVYSINPLSGEYIDALSIDETHPNREGHSAVLKELISAFEKAGIHISIPKPDLQAFSEELQ